VGWHGGAVLARLPLVEPRVVRVEPGGRWFDGALGERRIGSRIAVLCRLPLLDRAGRAREVALASLHLESHSDPDERAAQLAAVFDALDRHAPGAPALVGGDVNTHSLGRAELEDRARLRAALAADPSRLADPVAHEPLFALAERRGFAWRGANPAGGVPTYKRDGRGALALDWFFARGLEVADPALHPTGALSDHEAIGLTVRLAPG
jgi:endonuclease/exonuclease/phosphatase (EEP) superfamily protein YafD